MITDARPSSRRCPAGLSSTQRSAHGAGKANASRLCGAAQMRRMSSAKAFLLRARSLARTLPPGVPRIGGESGQRRNHSGPSHASARHGGQGPERVPEPVRGWGLFDAGGLGHQDDGASIRLSATDCSPDLSNADIAAVRFLYP